MAPNPPNRWSLSHLSDEELHAQLIAHEARRREARMALAAQLAEIERRRIHVEMGYSSLFDFCVREFNMDEDDLEELLELVRQFAEARAGTSGG